MSRATRDAATARNTQFQADRVDLASLEPVDTRTFGEKAQPVVTGFFAGMLGVAIVKGLFGGDDA